MTTRQRDLAVALGSLLILLTALRGGRERSTPEPVAEFKGVVSGATGAVIPQFPRRSVSAMSVTAATDRFKRMADARDRPRRI
jgi:hypothetical protein